MKKILLTISLLFFALSANAEGGSVWSWFDDLFGDEVDAEAVAVEEVIVTEEALTVSSFPEGFFVDRAHFTNQVVDREPVDVVVELYSDFGDSINFYTDIRECVDCTLEHEWVFEGEVKFTLPTEVRYPRYRWWSTKNHLLVGVWTVNVLINGENVATKTLNFIEATRVQVQLAPLEYHMRKRAVSNCGKELERWRRELKESPDDDYVQFKVDQLEDRCSVNSSRPSAK